MTRLVSSAAAGMPSPWQVLTSWQPTTAVLVGCGLVAALYAHGVARRARPWPVRRALAFACGLVAVMVSLDSGLDAYAERLASLHMVQHLALTLIAAPLLAAGAPITLTLGATRGRTRARMVRVLGSAPVRVLSRPVSSWLLFVGAMVGWHLSPLYELSLRHPILHELEHLVLLSTAVLFWTQVVGVDPLRHRPGPIGRLIYLLSAMPAMSVIGVWLVASTTVRYPAYVATARTLGVSALHDQQIAGAIMWGGDALLGAITFLIACRELVHDERREAARDSHRAPRVAPASIGGTPP